MKVIVFRLGTQDFGVEVAQVQSIERVQAITPIPQAPPSVKGVVDLRGVVTAVIDLRERLCLDAEPIADETRMIVVRAGDHDLALIVSAAQDVVDLDSKEVLPPPAAVGGVRAKYLRGVAHVKGALLVLLNLDRILSDTELAELEEIARS